MSKKTMADSKRGAKISDINAAAPASKPQSASRKAPSRAAQQRGRPSIVPDPSIVAEIFRRFEAANPHPKGELEHVNAFTLLVAVVLSAQATDVGVNKATRALFAVADTPAKMVALGEEKLKGMIKSLGFYNMKARNVIALSERLCKYYGGEVPQSREALESLPGVGRKTANIVLNTIYGEPLIGVDTHIFRVSNRIPIAVGKTPLEVEQGLEKIIPAKFLRHAHHWLVLHGRYTCTARKPDCPHCLINDLCRWPDKRV